jgi:hypothetical protein
MLNNKYHPMCSFQDIHNSKLGQNNKGLHADKVMKNTTQIIIINNMSFTHSDYVPLLSDIGPCSAHSDYVPPLDVNSHSFCCTEVLA